MTTLKQMEALYWISRLGSFERAAGKLNTTQSAISKRIQELEAASAEPLFNRAARTARLTAHGRLLLEVCEEMLRLRGRVDELMKPAAFPRGRFRVGVTEMTALTWLPAFVSSLRAAYPRLDLEPEVESSETLFDRLQRDLVDIIVVPDVFRDSRFTSVPVGEVRMSWMCSARFPLPAGRLALRDLEHLTVLAQDDRSGSGLTYRRWLEEQGVRLTYKVSSNSLIALIGMTVSGLGISYLPLHACAPLLGDGGLRVIETDPPLPAVSYVAMLRDGPISTYETFVVERVKACCDFTTPLYASGRTELAPSS